MSPAVLSLNTLSFGEEVIREVYDVYGLKKEIKGYPSLNERIQIINSKIDEVNNLAKIFEIGNVLLRLGEYELAKKCFQEILNKGFTSREIYNNLGLVYLLYGISIEDEKISKFQEGNKLLKKIIESESKFKSLAEDIISN